MKISRSTGYALLAVGYIAQNKEKKVTLSQDIAQTYDIPLEYLLKILQQLVRAEILHSKRGPRGGFSLAKTPKQINLLHIIEAVDGPLDGKLNLRDQAPNVKFVAKAEQAYHKALNQAKSVFQKTKIADII